MRWLVRFLLLEGSLQRPQATLLPYGDLLDRRGGGAAAAPLRHGEAPVCIGGHAVPRLHLLGAAKCGTTTVANDLVTAGAEDLFPGVKEPGDLERVCDVHLVGCPPLTPGARDRWLAGLYQRKCSVSTGTLLDATPNNLDLPGLPAFLSGLYGGASKRLAFVVMLREPLQRMQSHWYMAKQNAEDYHDGVLYHKGYTKAVGADSFQNFLKSLEPKLLQLKAWNYEGLGVEKETVIVWPSLYGLTFQPWLQNFGSEQFLLVPMVFYVGSTRNRDHVIQRLASKFGATLSTANLGEQLWLNRREHPTLAEDIDNATARRWYKEFFRPDLKLLAKLLVKGIPGGLELAGYSGTANPSSSMMFAHLCTALPCLM